MEPENTHQEVEHTNKTSQLHQVTPLSKYLAMALLIILPFVGGYVGYVYAPEKVVEVEKIVEDEPATNEQVEVEQDVLVGDQQELGSEVLDESQWEKVQYGRFVDVNPVEYPINNEQFLASFTATSGITFRSGLEHYALKARKVSDNLSLVIVGIEADVSSGVVLYDEIQRKMINLVEYPYLPYTIGFVDTPMTRWISHSALVTVLVGHQGTGQPSQVVMYEYAEQKKIVLYEEKDLRVDLADSCEMQCHGLLYLTSDGHVIFGRHKSVPVITATQFLETVSVPIPEEYLSQRQKDARNSY